MSTLGLHQEVQLLMHCATITVLQNHTIVFYYEVFFCSQRILFIIISTYHLLLVTSNIQCQ